MPPGLSGNIDAISAYIQFFPTPISMEIVHNSAAPQPPNAPIEYPNDPMRKPGFASATTKPSYQRIPLNSSVLATATSAMILPPYFYSVIKSIFPSIAVPDPSHIDGQLSRLIPSPPGG